MKRYVPIVIGVVALCAVLDIGEAGAGIGHIEIEGHPRQYLVRVGPFDADAAARPARLSGAVIADK